MGWIKDILEKGNKVETSTAIVEQTKHIAENTAKFEHFANHIHEINVSSSESLMPLFQQELSEALKANDLKKAEAAKESINKLANIAKQSETGVATAAQHAEQAAASHGTEIAAGTKNQAGGIINAVKAHWGPLDSRVKGVIIAGGATVAAFGAFKGGQAIAHAMHGKEPSKAEITQAQINQIRAEQGAGKFETMLNERGNHELYAGR